MRKIKKNRARSKGYTPNWRFLYLIADTGAAAIQYGMREQFCDLVESQGQAGYARATEMVAQLFGNLTNMSAQAGENISLEANSGEIGIRQWLYQSCTEFGFWQNATQPDMSARSQWINPEYHQNLCKRLFNVTTPANVIATNKNFYEPILDKKTSKILFTNGFEDPWMNLSITDANKNNVNLNVESLVIGGAAHCDDLNPGSSNSETQKARRHFVELAKSWVSSK